MTTTDTRTEPTPAQVAIVQAVLGAWLDRVDPGASEYVTAYPSGFHANGPTLASEEARYGWPSDFIAYLHVSRGWQDLEGLHLEPVSHWCLGIYPA